jgi:hypothetical protein
MMSDGVPYVDSGTSANDGSGVPIVDSELCSDCVVVL